jgi:hypothetical protein
MNDADVVEQVRCAHARWMLDPRSSRERFTWYYDGGGDGVVILRFVLDDAPQLDIAYTSGAIAFGKGPFTGLRIDLSTAVVHGRELVVDCLLHAYDNAWSARDERSR